ncbi:hypothetical protein SBC1_27100 [Caballeronia sp. SBC1]|uniref:hypothetical protein n=1 Tax=Caballeronia sp. SBC1 TaxID=2705548 RepID=UPI00140F248E|nr:hypothetical protein SBC1_27100 [Caballeronia sp. SBC1]
MKASIPNPAGQSVVQPSAQGEAASATTAMMMPADQSESLSPGRHELWYHARHGAITLVVLAAFAAGLAAAMWFASFFLYASLRVNPFHAGMWGWFDAARAWYAGGLPKEGRRIAGSALFGLLLAYGAPGAAAYALWGPSGRRHLYGSARFASEAEIRAAGLL